MHFGPKNTSNKNEQMPFQAIFEIYFIGAKVSISPFFQEMQKATNMALSSQTDLTTDDIHGLLYMRTGHNMAERDWLLKKCGAKHAPKLYYKRQCPKLYRACKSEYCFLSHPMHP